MNQTTGIPAHYFTPEEADELEMWAGDLAEASQPYYPQAGHSMALLRSILRKVRALLPPE